MKPKWQKNKPNYACTFLTEDVDGEYRLWDFAWEIAEPPEDFVDESEGETTHYYLAWSTHRDDEWDDIAECNFDKYLVLRKLPTMDEVHKQRVERLRKCYKYEIEVTKFNK